MENVSIALAQMRCGLGDREANLKRMEELISQTTETASHCRLILFPELCTTGYSFNPFILEWAEPKDGPSFQHLSKIACEYGISILYGYPEKEGDAVYNSAQYIGANGESRGNYRKIQLTDMEQQVFTPGNKLVLVDDAWGKVGIMICWDMAFPELASALTAKGAEILLVPCAWESPFQIPFERFSMARSIDNAIFLGTTNHGGQEGAAHFFGNSRFYSPRGDILINCPTDNEEIQIVRLQQEHLQQDRSYFYTMLHERKPKLYAEWLMEESR